MSVLALWGAVSFRRAQLNEWERTGGIAIKGRVILVGVTLLPFVSSAIGLWAWKAMKKREVGKSPPVRGSGRRCRHLTGPGRVRTCQLSSNQVTLSLLECGKRDGGMS